MFFILVIKVNDLVFAKDVENNKKDYKIVKELYQNKVDTILKLNIDGQIINTTLNHPLYKKDIGFVEASKLEVNYVLLNSDDEEVKVLAKEEISSDEGIVVYNLNVEDYHTYYVGSNNVLVHNKCWQNSIIKRNIKMLRENYLKKKGIDPHSLKIDGLGTDKGIAKYDIYLDKDTK